MGVLDMSMGEGLTADRGVRPWVWGIAVSAVAGLVLILSRSRSDFWSAVAARGPEGALEIQHPIQGAVMPLNMPPPVVLWKTNVPGIGSWTVGLRVGRRRWLFPEVSPMWRPPQKEWDRIKAAAVDSEVEIGVAGRRADRGKPIQAAGSVRVRIASERLEAPLFYREVNLPFREAVKDPSQIRWRFGAVEGGTLPPVVLQNLPVCGNCHSFTRHGEYLAMDVDYANDKGSYVITRTGAEMRLATSDIITWDDFRPEDGQPTLGLLSQISPDGRYVLSTVKDLSLFMAKPDLAFSQLFFPFLGIIGVYDRETKRFFALPGADDPAWVQSNPVWSPDGQWVVFARARAIELRAARRQGRVLLTEEDAQDLLQQTRNFCYDLYRLPFNAGKGGQATPLRGASANGRSNYFPKYSPDGRWIVYCRANNYMLLQPDSELFIIPAQGGEARRLGCNLGLMNSWHSWSPDGRWLVFSSKAHSIYTQLYLTRMSEEGEASPPVWLAHMVGPGRAANIPEFVDLRPDAIARIREQFLDDYSYVRAGDEFRRAGDIDGAIAKYRKALTLNPDNVQAHEHLGALLFPNNPQEAIQHLRVVVSLYPRDPFARFDLGCALRNSGDSSNAIVQLQESLRWLPARSDLPPDPKDWRPNLAEGVHLNLGLAYHECGRVAEAEEHYREALRYNPNNWQAHLGLGYTFLAGGHADQAAAEFREALRIEPAAEAARQALARVQPMAR